MGNVLRDQCRFFSIPQEFVESGCLLEVSPSGCKLYTLLYYLAQKHSAVRLEFSNAQLRAFTGLDTKSIQSARVQLSDLRLITTQKGALGVYTYTLLNPTTGQALPSPEGRTGLRRYHGPPSELTNRQSETSVKIKPEHPSLAHVKPRAADEVGGAAAFCCFACHGTHFWTRGRDRICARCHPDPRVPILQRETCSPTASELGF